MRVLVIEDIDHKWKSLADALERNGVPSAGIVRVKSMSGFLAQLDRSFDLCIVDLWVPYVDEGDPVDVGSEVFQLLDNAGGFRVPVLVITAFIADAARHVARFASKGSIIYDYAARTLWEAALGAQIAGALDRNRYDFLLITALEEERQAYLRHSGVDVESVMRNGIDLWDFEWAGKRGGIVLLPRMGLVSAAVTTARVLENYSPVVLGMSGICAGIGKDAHLGRLLVTDLCWEYQSGKWSNEYFSAEPYQVQISEKLRTLIKKFLENKKLLAALEEGFDHGSRPSKMSSPSLAIFASGSAVIASQKKLDSVKKQHRRVAGIDMELYAFHLAARASPRSVVDFSAKVVVDKATVEKDDDLHAYGCYVSSKFALKLVEKLFSDKSRVVELAAVDRPDAAVSFS